VHHCDSWRIKDQLDVTCYFISLLMCSTCFGHYTYIRHQELATILLNYHIGRIVLVSMCVGVSLWLGWSGIRVAGFNVVIQQNSRMLLMIDILMSETCWAHKKWNKIASDIKLVFYSPTIKKYIHRISYKDLASSYQNTRHHKPVTIQNIYWTSYCINI